MCARVRVNQEAASGYLRLVMVSAMSATVSATALARVSARASGLDDYVCACVLVHLKVDDLNTYGLYGANNCGK